MPQPLFDFTATQALGRNAAHGGAEYARQVFRRFISADCCEFEGVYRDDLDLEPWILDACKQRGIILHAIKSNRDIEALLHSGAYSRFFAPLPYGYAELNTGNAKLTAVIHGLRSLEMSEIRKLSTTRYSLPSFTQGLRHLAKRLARFDPSRVKLDLAQAIRFRAKGGIEQLLVQPNAEIVAVSQHTKYSLLLSYPRLSPDQICVCQSPIEDMTTYLEDPIANKEKGNYFLLLNADREEKNVRFAVKAIDELFSAGFLDDKRCVILGCDTLIKECIELRNPERFDLRGYVDKSRLACYFSEAFCLVYPSLSEGFGYPPVNAMQFGVPVVASANSSITEICNNSALYFNPMLKLELQNRLLQVACDKEQTASMIIRGKRRYAELKEAESLAMDMLRSLVFR
jgi:glycosyltransferase involved in cell wall biosynthesis